MPKPDIRCRFAETPCSDRRWKCDRCGGLFCDAHSTAFQAACGTICNPCNLRLTRLDEVAPPTVESRLRAALLTIINAANRDPHPIHFNVRAAIAAANEVLSDTEEDR